MLEQACEHLDPLSTSTEETKALDIWLHDTEAACMYANIFFLNMAGAQIKLPSSSSHSKTECDHRNIHNDCFKKIEF